MSDEAVQEPVAAEAAAAEAGAAAPPPAAAKAVAKGGLTPAMLEKAVKQIEFYFSDSNLPRDKFLLEQTHATAEGYVDVGVICSFARMREILKVRLQAERAAAGCPAALRRRLAQPSEP